MKVATYYELLGDPNGELVDKNGKRYTLIRFSASGWQSKVPTHLPKKKMNKVLRELGLPPIK